MGYVKNITANEAVVVILDRDEFDRIGIPLDGDVRRQQDRGRFTKSVQRGEFAVTFEHRIVEPKAFTPSARASRRLSLATVFLLGLALVPLIVAALSVIKDPTCGNFFVWKFDSACAWVGEDVRP